MTSSVGGVIRVRNVIGSSPTGFTAFDGSAPYSISTSAELNLVNGSGSTANLDGKFCLISAPGDYEVVDGVFPDGVETGLAKQCVIRLRDIWVEVQSSSASNSRCVFGIAVYDPSSAFPSPTAANTHLYSGVFESGQLNIPDIKGLVVSAGLNVGFWFYSPVAAGSNIHLNIHSVCDIDD